MLLLTASWASKAQNQSLDQELKSTAAEESENSQFLYNTIQLTILGDYQNARKNFLSLDTLYPSIENDPLRLELLQWRSYMNKIEREFSGRETNLHDVIALCSLTKPDILNYEKYYIDIECKGELTRGMTVADFRNVYPEKELNVTVATSIDVNAFWVWFISIYKGEFK